MSEEQALQQKINNGFQASLEKVIYINRLNVFYMNCI